MGKIVQLSSSSNLHEHKWVWLTSLNVRPNVRLNVRPNVRLNVRLRSECDATSLNESLQVQI